MSFILVIHEGYTEDIISTISDKPNEQIGGVVTGRGAPLWTELLLSYTRGSSQKGSCCLTFALHLPSREYPGSRLHSLQQWEEQGYSTTKGQACWVALGDIMDEAN